ncbi:TPA: helix-turn-helix domain-containing protein [Pasteurella multocida]|uniref:helix-turn-helix domain-containing protein n=1 Tax=Gammaproteobacteria TaxID=1236 RepID=UPI00319E7D54
MRRTNHRNLVNVGILSGRIPLISLVQFIAVAEHLNFRHAAKALGISQSSVSARVKALEDNLGVLLFERHARGVRRLAVAVAVLQRSRHRAHAVELLRPHDRKRHPSPGATVTPPA